MKTWVFNTNGDTVVQRINANAPVLQPVTPISSPPLVFDLVQDPADASSYLVTISGGVVGITYAALVEDGPENGLLVCNVVDAVQAVVPYSVVNSEAYNDLIGDLDVGQSAVGTGVFAFGPEVDASGGHITWELLDNQGRIWGNGSAFDYSVQSNGWSVTAMGRALVTAPSDIPEVLDSQAYQLRWTLQLPDGQKVFSFENIRITAGRTTPLGAANEVAIRGDTAEAQIVLDQLYDNVILEIYWDNEQVGSLVVAAPGLGVDPIKNASGWTYRARIDTSTMTMPYIKPWSMLWKYWRSTDPNFTQTERADLWVINPTISQAMEDMKAKINKARTTIYGAPDLLFPYSTILTWLRRAADAFNVSYGVLTSITFTNPSGPLREYWLMIAEMNALESQYLAEGEKAFDFQGAAISLTVDQTQYLDAMASKLQARLDNELKPIKQNIIMKGNQAGDGSGDPRKLKTGAMGTVGISISPATPYYGYGGVVPGRIYPRII